MPATLPGALSRRQRFDRKVADAAAALCEVHPELAEVSVVVEDVPDVPVRAARIPLGRVVRQTAVPQLVVHRRAVESHAAADELICDVLAELAGDLLVRPPGELDPRYPRAR